MNTYREHQEANRNNLMLGIFIGAIIALVLAACAGCKSTSASYDAKTGDWKISDRRVFLRTEAEISAGIDTNGTRTVTIKAKSDPQADAFKAIAEGAALSALALWLSSVATAATASRR